MSLGRYLTYPELNSLPSGAGGLGGMVQQARQAACGAYRRYPWAFLGFFPDSAVGQAYQGLWDKICPEAPPPTQPLPSTPTWRGNCPIGYTVQGRIFFPADPSVPVDGIPYSVSVQGPILGQYAAQSGSDGIERGIQGTGSGSSNGRVFVAGTSGGTRRGFRITITNVIPQSASTGAACETQPPPRQYDSPFTPDSNDFVGPPGPASPVPGPNPPTDRPVPIPPQFPSIPIPVPVLIKPYIPVYFGPFNFQFDLGGVTLGFNPTFNINFGSPSQPPQLPGNPLPPSPPRIEPGGEADCPPVDLQPILDAIASSRANIIQNIANQTDRLTPIEPTIQYNTVAAGVDSGVISLPANAVTIRFLFVDRPVNEKAQNGGSNAPLVTFAGWVSFGGGVFQGGHRIPLDYESSQVFVPPFATNFTFCAKAGRSVSVQVGVAVAGNRKIRSDRFLAWEVP